MNEAEIRRKKLLEQTRKSYDDRHTPPVIHPRYRAAYKSVYREETETAAGGTFGIRFLICLVLFGMFVAMDIKGEKVADVSSDRIIEEIQSETELEGVWEDWTAY